MPDVDTPEGVPKQGKDQAGHSLSARSCSQAVRATKEEFKRQLPVHVCVCDNEDSSME